MVLPSLSFEAGAATYVKSAKIVAPILIDGASAGAGAGGAGGVCALTAMLPKSAMVQTSGFRNGLNIRMGAPYSLLRQLLALRSAIGGWAGVFKGVRGAGQTLRMTQEQKSRRR